MKTIHKILAVAIVIAAAGVTVYNAQTEDLQMSELAMENIEAIASSESGGNPCEYRITYRCMYVDYDVSPWNPPIEVYDDSYAE